MASKPIITILGLGVTGASLGLALQRSAAQAEIVGHDKEPEASQAARRNNAVQRVEWNLHAACEPASLIVLGLPLNEVDGTLELIRDDIRPEALVLVLGDVLQPVTALLDSRLQGQRHGVAGHVVLNGVGGALTPRADLFDKAVFVIAAGVKTDPSALELASNFVESVGAQPLFMDPAEHDGIMAGVEQLPQLLGLALLHMLAGAPGWTEARRLAGRTFAHSTDPGRSSAHLYTALLANRANVLLRLDQFERELAAWKQWLAAAPAPAPAGAAVTDSAAGSALMLALADSVEQRQAWQAQALLQNWDTAPTAEEPEAQPVGIFRQMFMGGWGSKKTPPPSDKTPGGA